MWADPTLAGAGRAADDDRVPLPQQVVVYGAYGHTGRFVTTELLRRGLVPVLAGRDPGRLAALAAGHPGPQHRVAAVDDPAALDAALSDAAAVVNCAGPFLDTAVPVAAAAVRAGAHYLDVAAEQVAVQAVHRALVDDARAAGVAVVPGTAFFGGLADLMATAALDDSGTADEITVAYALDRWWPTAGTRDTGRRNTAARLVVSGGRLVPLEQPPATRTWAFPDPFGSQPVVENPFSEVVLLAAHLRATTVRTHLNLAPLDDLHDPATPGPRAVDASGRSAQRFVVDVVVRTGARERRTTVAGRDVYAATAPIVVEAVVRLLDGRSSATGVTTPGAAFDAGDVLDALAPHPLTVLRREVRASEHA